MQDESWKATDAVFGVRVETSRQTLNCSNALLPVPALQTPLNQGCVDRRRGWARATELLSIRASEQMGWLRIAVRDHSEQIGDQYAEQ